MLDAKLETSNETSAIRLVKTVKPRAAQAELEGALQLEPLVVQPGARQLHPQLLMIRAIQAQARHMMDLHQQGFDLAQEATDPPNSRMEAVHAKAGPFNQHLVFWRLTR
jgi:hypothetical protein